MNITRDRQFVRSLALAWSVLTAAGCVSYLSEERTGSPTVTAIRVPARSVGPARLTVTPHNDGLGWIVSAERMTIDESLVETSQDWTGRWYVFSPLSIIPGLVQCPIGLVRLFDPNPANKDFRYGCARLAMMEPIEGQVALPPTRSFAIHRKTTWEPLPHGIVQLEWPDSAGGTVTYALGRQGLVDVRLADLLVRTTQSLPVSAETSLLLRLRYDDGTAVDRTLAVSPAQLLQASTQLPSAVASEVWPTRLILKVQVDSSSGAEREAVRDRLTSWIIQEGFCAVVGDDLHRPLVDEHRVQYSGSPDGHQAVRLGQLRAPNVLLHAMISNRTEGPDQIKEIALHLTDAQAGKIVAVSKARTRTQVLSNPLDRALADLERMTAYAPRNGCPPTGKGVVD